MEQQSPVGRIWQWGEAEHGRLITAVVLAVLGTVCGMVPYFAAAKIITLLLAGEQALNAYTPWLLTALCGYLLRTVLYNSALSISHKATYNILKTIRQMLLAKLPKLPLGTVMDTSSGKLKQTIVDQVDGMETTLAHLFPEMTANIAAPVLTIVYLFVLDWRLALLSLVVFPVAFFFMMTVMGGYGKDYAGAVQATNEMSSTLIEYINGIEVIKAFGLAGVSYEKYAKSITDFRTFVVKWLSSTWVTMKLAFALFPSTLIGTLPMSLWLAEKGILTTAQAALAVMLSMSMVGSLAKLEVFSENMRQVKATVESLEAFLELPALPEPAQPAALSGTGVERKSVHFAYRADGPEVLHGIDLTLPQGSFTALVGPSGGGKSTVAKLIARFWDVTDGSITVGGTDVRAMPLSQLSGLVSFVTQDNYLFRCSLLENIRLGVPSATDEQVKAAARAAQCEEFIAKLPQGYDTPAGEAGKRLSGGEKQRIAIARMLLKNAPIVILDEATAFTDPENEDKIQQSIAALTRGKTLLVIAHRLSTIKNADNIVVLKEGRIEAQGTQAQLLETCPLYRTMWEAHIGAKAWAVSSAGKEE